MLNFFRASDGHIRSSAILTVVGLILTGLLAILHALPQTEIVLVIITIISAILNLINKPK